MSDGVRLIPEPHLFLGHAMQKKGFVFLQIFRDFFPSLSLISCLVYYFFRLEVLYLGGNKLTEIPAEMGYLQNLTCLSLCDNQLESLPPTLIHLRKLQSLSLHNNQLQTLPPQIVTLNLYELSLRNNPLVMRLV
jgi:Leucine-rich repeat (LRR) protein